MLGVALTAGAQNKIDYPGRIAIDAERTLQLQGGANGEGNSVMSAAAASTAQERKYGVIVEFYTDDINYGGVEVEELSTIANLAIVNATAAQMESLAALPGVKKVSLGFDNKPLMYMARPAAKVDAIQAGIDGVKYTGKGVVTGLFDTGFDVNHVNFLDADGEPRTKAVWAYSSTNRETAYTTPSQIKGFTTENSDESHGTHVLGIMSGSYSGPATYALIEKNKAKVIDQDAAESSVPFYGVATEADIAVGCGPLSDKNILLGVQRIVEYAKTQKQPCVVNLSLGSTLGPHDGSDGIAAGLAELGKDAVICISAGNEGNQNLSISTSGKAIKTFIVPSDGNKSAVVQFWGSDSRLFNVRFIGYNRSTGKEVFSYTLDKNLAGKSVKQSDMTGFSSTFSGSVSLSSNIDTGNNRYCVSATVNVTGIQSTILAGFVIEPAADQSVDGFINNWTFSSESLPGFTNGSPDNSINNMACGENVIVVGSYTTAATWAALLEGGKTTTYGYNPRPSVGAISSFSSYGTAFPDRKLPDVCAPGEVIISSYSKYYVDKNPGEWNGSIAGEYEAPKGLLSRNSPWGVMQGTSMSCPLAAGIIAAWLQADPTMTVEDVRNVINKSSLKDLSTKQKPARWGAGKIDALAGLKEVLSSAGISDVTADDLSDVIITSADGRTFDIFAAGAKRIQAELYSISGLRVATVAGESENTVLDATSAAPGVYLLKVATGKSSVTRKIAIK